MDSYVEPGTVVGPGPFQGWRTWAPLDPFESLAGPFHFRIDPDGCVTCGFLAERRHLNVMGAVHGGCLMTFADFALFAIAYPKLGTTAAVTVSLTGDFVAAGREGDLIQATGEVLRCGRSLVFVRGLISVATTTVMAFSGVVKRLD